MRPNVMINEILEESLYSNFEYEIATAWANVKRKLTNVVSKF